MPAAPSPIPTSTICAMTRASGHDRGRLRAARQQGEGYACCSRSATSLMKRASSPSASHWASAAIAAEHVGERLHLRLGVIAEHVGGDEVLAGPGWPMPMRTRRKSGPSAASIERRPLWPGEPAADPHLHLERREVELVVEDGEVHPRRACRSCSAC